MMLDLVKLKLSRKTETCIALAGSFSISFNSKGPRYEAGFRRFPRQLTQPAEFRGLFRVQKDV